ncbi:MAG: helix-turn-helix domain-containing protein [Phycisphaerae bacterium]|nr:helix-turn-helix domain-containing protein [Phycisphaerae bacterium]
MDNPLLGALLSDPASAVSLVRLDGTMVYCNPQWDRLMSAAHPGHGEHMTGLTLKDIFTTPQALEFGVLLHRSIEGKQPLLVRKLCGGRMFRCWLYPIEPTGRAPFDRPLVAFLVRAEMIEEAPTESLPVGAAAVEFRSGGMGPLEVLSPRELEVLSLLAEGMTIREIAAKLHRSEKTIDKHRTSIHTKLGVHDRVALCDIARRAGLRSWSLQGAPFQ